MSASCGDDEEDLCIHVEGVSVNDGNADHAPVGEGKQSAEDPCVSKAKEDTSDIPEWKVENDYSHYRPFDHSKREIRLVTIRPGLFDEPLHCTLTPHPLPCPGIEFEALSYCWGDLKDTLSITLCHDYTGYPDPECQQPEKTEQSFNVTRSLDLALRYLRLEDKVRVIWIDALCINQGSIKERNYAISFMVDVYRHADLVVIFLGEESKSKHFRGMWDLMAMLNAGLQRAQVKPLWQHEDIDKALDEINITPKSNKENKEGDHIFRIHMSLIFEEFFKYPWFKRVWVIQEAMNAKEAVVYCGSKRADWLDILVMLCWAVKMSRSYAGAWSASLDLRDRLPPFLWTRLHAAKRGEIHAPARLPLLDVISKGRAFGATDPRDKVFALLNFGEETHDLPGLPPRLKPDYGKSSSDVWRDLTRQWIIDHESLDILAIQRETVDKNNQVASATVFVRAEKDPPLPESKPSNAIELPPAEHPSWALWHAEHPEAAQSALFRGANNLSRCSLTLNVDLLDRPSDPAVLRLPGLVLDRIKSVQWPFKRWSFSDDDMRQFDYSREPPVSVQSGVSVAWGALIGAIKGVGENTTGQVSFHIDGQLNIPPYPSGSSLIQAFVETLICRRLSRNYFAPNVPMSLEPEHQDQLTDDMRADLKIFADFAAHWEKGVDPEMKWIPGPCAQCLKPLAKHGNPKQFTERCEYAEGRCFFEADRAVMGLCPRGARPGDYVASMAGGKTPFVLRPLDEKDDHASRFLVVGECYLHDLDIARITQKMVDEGKEPGILAIV
ncbi:hypothetical protein DL765_003244 [Monosporascus sp. GIB2]|nr:hypothetical protein DL765_003244 [Monosporascus sp. GIB2]